MGSELQSGRWKKLCARLKVERPALCWYCGEPIDLALPGTHPQGWTLDHVIPRFEAPHLTWVESNLMPAHHDCNSKRGARPQQVNISRLWR